MNIELQTDGLIYKPFDTSGTGRTEGSPLDCQKRCENTTNCFHFNSLRDGGCYIAGKNVTLHSNPNNPTVVRGKMRCGVESKFLESLFQIF